jgi:hypothetical protein
VRGRTLLPSLKIQREDGKLMAAAQLPRTNRVFYCVLNGIKGVRLICLTR